MRELFAWRAQGESEPKGSTSKRPDGSFFRVWKPYYAAGWDACGWSGSSEECGNIAAQAQEYRGCASSGQAREIRVVSVPLNLQAPFSRVPGAAEGEVR